MKYRVHNSKYGYDEGLSCTNNGCPIIIFGDYIYEDVDDPENCVIEICSGIRDVDGNLIYENDLVSYEFNGELHENQLVKFSEEVAAFTFGGRSLADSFNYLVGIHSLMRNFKITGNFHDVN